MNHASFAASALRFRLSTLESTLVDSSRFDIDGAAAVAVSCGDPDIDSALRRLGNTWIRAGLDPSRLCEPWRDADAARLLHSGGSAVIDALDDIVDGVNRQAIYT